MILFTHYLRTWLYGLICLLALAACTTKDNAPQPTTTVQPAAPILFKQNYVVLSTYSLTTYMAETTPNRKYLVVFESGYGNDHTVWNKTGVADSTKIQMDALTYDRAGYRQSGFDNSPRDIDHLRQGLEAVVNKWSNGRKVVLVGHSLGGFIIRDFAIKNSTKTAALFFIDPSAENKGTYPQDLEDELYNDALKTYGPNAGATLEARQFAEDWQYMTTVGSLPDVPVTVLTAMKETADASAAARQSLYNAHELLKKGVTDFTHIGVPTADHYIQYDAPDVVITNLKKLIARLP